MYRRLKRVMEKRLYYFYQQTKKSIHLLFISSLSFFFSRIFYVMFYAIVEEDRYNAYTGVSKFTFFESVTQFILFNVTATLLFIHCYLSTRHMDFALYVRAWMIGYNVLNKYDKMSFLITPSCFFQDD